MECEIVKPLLLAHVEGTLPRAKAALVHEHLDACAACRAEYDRLGDARSILQEHGDWREVEPSEELTNALLRRVREEAARPRRESLAGPNRRRAMVIPAAAALLLAAAGILLVIDRQGDGPQKQYLPKYGEAVVETPEVVPVRAQTPPPKERSAPPAVPGVPEKPGEEPGEVVEDPGPSGKDPAPPIEPAPPKEVVRPEPGERLTPPKPPPGTVVMIPIAEVDGSFGTIRVKPNGTGDWKKIRKPARLFSGDLLKTGTKGIVALVLSDGSAIILHSNSEIALERQESEGKSGRWIVGLNRGGAICQVMSGREPGNFLVRTPAATVEVKGTEFYMLHRFEKTLLAVFEGEVECSNAAGSVRVAQGFSTRVIAGKKPAGPVKLDPKALAGMTSWARRIQPVPEPVADAKLPAGFGYYEGNGRGVWGRTRLLSRSGRYCAFLKAVEFPKGKSKLNVSLVIGDSNGYIGADAFKTEPGVEYSFSFWTRGNFRKPIFVCLSEWSSDKASVEERVTGNNNVHSFMPTRRWTRISGSFTTHPKAVKFILHLQAFGGKTEQNFGVLYVDDVSISRKGSDENIVSNPGAEKAK